MTKDAKDNEGRWLHRTMAALGAVIVLGMIVQFGIEGLSRTSGPPEVDLSIERTQRLGDVWAVQVRARNPSDRTAANVQIEGTLTAGGQSETSQATLDYVPDGSARTAGLYFTHDPAQGALDLRVVGYSEP